MIKKTKENKTKDKIFHHNNSTSFLLLLSSSIKNWELHILIIDHVSYPFFHSHPWPHLLVK